MRAFFRTHAHSKRESWNLRWTVLLQPGCCSARAWRRMRIYLFKHALVQDAAYSTLLRVPRQSIHARIAKVLEQQSLLCLG